METAHAIDGIHHITLVASNAQRTVDFYVDLLGMRLVKKTVNFDRPDSYHLYFGDETGSPGTLVTFFEWHDAEPARLGIGVTHHFALTVGTFDGLLKWKTRLQHAHRIVAGPFDHSAYRSIVFTDPDGVVVEIATEGPGWAGPESGPDTFLPPQGQLAVQTWPEPVTAIEPDMRLGALHHISAIAADIHRTHAFFEDVLGIPCLHRTIEPGPFPADRWYWSTTSSGVLGQPGTVITYATLGEPEPVPRGHVGHGLTHHFALNVTGEAALEYWRQRILEHGYDVTPILDRKYFRSIYFHDPDGILIEMATPDPGFLVDEPEERLGERLALPAWLEGDRAKIESGLRPIAVGP